MCFLILGPLQDMCWSRTACPWRRLPVISHWSRVRSQGMLYPGKPKPPRKSSSIPIILEALANKWELHTWYQHKSLKKLGTIINTTKSFYGSLQILETCWVLAIFTESLLGIWVTVAFNFLSSREEFPWSDFCWYSLTPSYDLTIECGLITGLWWWFKSNQFLLHLQQV